MEQDLKIGIVGSYCGRPLDILLPTVAEDDLAQTDNGGRCFHIQDLTRTEFSLFCKYPDGLRRTAKIDVRTACRANSDMSICIVKTKSGELFLRTYTDATCNGLFPISQLLD